MDNQQLELEINANNLYREESITDLQVGAIRCLIPVKVDGSEDSSRETLFIGSTQLRSPQGMIPVQARIEASNFEDALAKFPGAMKAEVENMVEEAKKMQAQQEQKEESSIIMPGR